MIFRAEFDACWQLCYMFLDCGPHQSIPPSILVFRPGLSEDDRTLFVSSLWCSTLQWLGRSSIKSWHNEAAFVHSLSLVCLVCFLIDGSQTGTKWNLWGPWHHFGPPSIHWQSLFCCKFVSGVYQARHLSDGYVSIYFSNLSLMSPTIFYHITLYARCTLMN